VPNGRRETVRPASIGASFVEASKKWRKPSKSIEVIDFVTKIQPSGGKVEEEKMFKVRP
jgi:hypothetical protein